VLQNNPADNVPIDQLANNRALTQRQKVGEVARQFEALLLKQILQETQKTVIPSEFDDDSAASGIYQDMVTSQLADSISKSGTVGLAQSLESQLTRQLQPADSTSTGASATGSSAPFIEPEPVRPPLSPRTGAWRMPVKEKASPALEFNRNELHPLRLTPSLNLKPLLNHAH